MLWSYIVANEKESFNGVKCPCICPGKLQMWWVLNVLSTYRTTANNMEIIQSAYFKLRNLKDHILEIFYFLNAIRFHLLLSHVYFKQDPP